jgi:hypothetical protein
LLKVIPSFSIAAVFEFLSLMGAESNVNLAGILAGTNEIMKGIAAKFMGL